VLPWEFCGSWPSQARHGSSPRANYREERLSKGHRDAAKPNRRLPGYAAAMKFSTCASGRSVIFMMSMQEGGDQRSSALKGQLCGDWPRSSMTTTRASRGDDLKRDVSAEAWSNSRRRPASGIPKGVALHSGERRSQDESAAKWHQAPYGKRPFVYREGNGKRVAKSADVVLTDAAKCSRARSRSEKSLLRRTRQALSAFDATPRSWLRKWPDRGAPGARQDAILDGAKHLNTSLYFHVADAATLEIANYLDAADANRARQTRRGGRADEIAR